MNRIAKALVTFIGDMALKFCLIFVFLCIGILWIEPSFGVLGALIGLLAVCTLLGAFLPMSSVNGIGTGLMGHTRTPRGYITTKWVACWIPLVPLTSYEVLESSESKRRWIGPMMFSDSETFKYRPQDSGLFWPQIWPILWIELAIILGPCLLHLGWRWLIGK